MCQVHSSDRLHGSFICGAKIIFIEKRRSCPASYEQGRRAALARSLGRTRNVFLTKMDTLLPQPTWKSSLSELSHARRKDHLHRKTQVIPRIARSDPQCFSHEDGYFAPTTNSRSSPSELSHARREDIFIENNIKNVLDGPDGACYIYVVEKQAEPRSHPGAIGRPGVHRYVLIRYSMTRWLCAAWSFFLREQI